jgi:hypothetical protein
MLTEMLGKGGRVCELARQGQIRCPLIVRPTSEDVVTGHVFQVLRAVNPRWWLPQLLNRALGTRRFRQQVFRGLKVDLWRNLPAYPHELLPWSEGSTQVDATIRWENPPTTIYVEAKFLADLSSRTSGNDGRTGFPGDQLIRNIRVGLWETGWLSHERLFYMPPRQLCVLLFAPASGHPLVAEYRHLNRLRQAIPHAEKIPHFPPAPFVGEFSYRMLTEILNGNRRWLTKPERRLADDVCEYLAFKAATFEAVRRARTVGPSPEFQSMDPPVPPRRLLGEGVDRSESDRPPVVSGAES